MGTARPIEPDDSRDMPECPWPATEVMRPIPGWPGYWMGSDRSVWLGAHRVTLRRIKSRPAVVFYHGGRGLVRSIEILHRATFSPWPERWTARIGPEASNPTIPRPTIPRPPMPPPRELPPAVLEPAIPDRPRASPPPSWADDDDDDAYRPGFPRGSSNGSAKLTEDDVIEARRLHRAGWTYPAMVARFGVGKVTLFYAISGKTWSHVPMR